MLSPEEQRTLRWLAVFAGGCTLEAVEAILDVPDAIDVLDSLVSKSLVRQIGTETGPRFTLLETIRKFGGEQLAQTAELAAARQAHAVWYSALAAQAAPHLAGAEQKWWLQRLELEKDNLRAAFRWGIETNDGALALQIASALGPYWFATGRWNEGRRSLEEALALDSDSSSDLAARAKVLYQAGFLARNQSDFARTKDLYEQCLALYRALEDKLGMVMVLPSLARISAHLHDPNAKQAYMSEAASLIESLPDSIEKARAYKDLFSLTFHSHDPITAESEHHLAESERIFRAVNSPAELVIVIGINALLALSLGDDAQAVARFEDLERIAAEISNDTFIQGRLLFGRALLATQWGDFAKGRQHVDAFIRADDNRKDYVVSILLVILAAILFNQKLGDWSAKVLGLGEKMFDMGPDSPTFAYNERFSATRGLRKKVRSHLGDTAYTKLHAAGQQLTLDDLLAIPHPSLDSPATLDALTARENDVLQLLAEALSNPQIAERLVVSRRTVDAHLRSIYDKLGVKSRDAAIRVARERGLLGGN